MWEVATVSSVNLHPSRLPQLWGRRRVIDQELISHGGARARAEKTPPRARPRDEARQRATADALRAEMAKWRAWVKGAATRRAYGRREVQAELDAARA